MDILELIFEKRQHIRYIANENGARKIKVFGSVARAEDKLDSDIDFLVTFEEGRSLFDLIALKEDLESLLHREVDVVTEESVHWNIRDRIKDEAIEI